MHFTLSDALIAKLDVATSGGERPIETLILDFTELEIQTKTLNEANNGEDPMTITYDAASGIGG